jgi:hypothetical protein
VNQKESYQRINHFIYYQYRLLKKGKDGGNYKQSEFIRINPDDVYYPIYGDKICSVSFFSRIIRNKVIARIEVYNFFLGKLNVKFTYRETNSKNQDYLCQCVADLFFIPGGNINSIRNVVAAHSKNIIDDCLWDLDLIAIDIIFKWYETGISLEQRDFNRLFEMFDCLNPILQHVLLYYFVYSVYFNPALWFTIQDVLILIHGKVLKDEVLNAFQKFDHAKLFNLVKNKSNSTISNTKPSFLDRILSEFLEVNTIIHSLGKDYTEAEIEYLLIRFRTSNRQFKKLIIRTLLNPKYNHSEVRYLYQNFLFYEPSKIFMSIIFKNVITKIKRTDQMDEFIEWNHAIIR